MVVRTSEQGKELAAKRWSKPRPELKGDDRRVRSFAPDSEEELHWIKVGKEHGLITDDMSRIAQQRRAYRIGTAKARAVAKVQQSIDELKAQLDALVLDLEDVESRPDSDFFPVP